MPERGPTPLLRHLRPGIPAPGAAADTSLAAQGALSTLGIIVQGAVRFLFSVLVGNVLGKVVLGAANAAISLSLFASLLQPSAAASSATKFVARARGAGDLRLAEAITAHLVRRTAVAALLLGAGAALSAPWLLDLDWRQGLLTGALVIVYSGYMFLRGVLFGAGQVPRATVWDIVSSAISLAALALVLWGRAQDLVLVPLIIGYGVYVAANLPGRVRGSLDPALVKEINGFVLLTLANGVAVGGFLQLSMVVARFFDASGAGAYAAALALATPASLVSRSLSLVLFPSLSAAYGRGDHEGVRRQTDLSTRALVVISMGTFGPLMLLSPALIRLFFPRAEFEEAAAILPVLLVAVMVLNVVIGATNTLLTREQEHARKVLVASIAGACVGLLAWVTTVPAFGVMAVAVGYLLGSLVMAVVPAVIAWRLERLHWGWMWGRLVLAGIVAGLLCWWEQSRELGVPTQIGLAVAFGLGWLTLSWPDVRTTADLVRRRG